MIMDDSVNKKTEEIAAHLENKIKLKIQLPDNLIDEILALSQKKEFKNSLAKIIENVITLHRIAKPIEDYQYILKHEYEEQAKNPNYQLDIAKIEKAQKEAFEKPLFKKTSARPKNILETSNVEQITDKVYKINFETTSKETVLNEAIPSKKVPGKETHFLQEDHFIELEKKFPNELKKFNEIFKKLAKIDKKEPLTENTLQVISKLLTIDLDQLQQFFTILKQDSEIMNGQAKDNHRVAPENIVTIEEKIEKNLGVPKHIADDQVKPLKQLIAELSLGGDQDLDAADESKINTTPPDLIDKKLGIDHGETAEDNTEKQTLEQACNEIQRFYVQWQNKSIRDIHEWALKNKGKLSKENRYETLAILDRANELVSGGQRLRDTQLLTILILSNSNKDQGKICQVHTGEGKTIVIAFLAALKILEELGTIDVVTSNDVLASDGVKKNKDFYGVFGISVAHNKVDENYVTGPKSCYQADIVYGTIGNFQFDYLKDTFEGLKTRGSRLFDKVILDEIDSMLIDNGSHIAKLATPFPGLESLRYVYIKIWQELVKAEEAVVDEVRKKLEEQEKVLNMQGLSKKEIHTQITESCSEILQSIQEQIKEKIIASKPANIELIPNHVKEYVESNMAKWIDHALKAKYQYHEDQQYIIKDEKTIVPVDYANTGVFLYNTIWSHGLHQFVQLKHNLQLTAETLTSSFISNIGYIKKYGNNISGLTGTLGSVAEQQLLSAAYKVSYAKIPTYKERRFKETKGLIISNENWENEVALEAIRQIESERAVLIIFETIDDLKRVENNLELLKQYSDAEFSLDTYHDESQSNITTKEVCPKNIILATNIGGRGTDLKTSPDLELKGGLHVIVGFLPYNKRVEDQAFGRTARQGHQGTAQLILRASDISKLSLELQASDLDLVRKQRDALERGRLAEVQQQKLPELNFQDALFNLFSELYIKLKKDNLKTNRAYTFVLKDLKEYWAFWLEKQSFEDISINDGKVDSEEVERVFKSFKRAAQPIIIKGQIEHNPFYCIQQADFHLQENKIAQAEAALNRAIQLSHQHSSLLAAVHLKFFEVVIEKEGVIWKRLKEAIGEVFVFGHFINNKDEKLKYREEAQKHLNESKKYLSQELEYLKSLIPSEKKQNENPTDFEKILLPVEKNILIKHLYSRQVCLELFLHNIDSQIDELKKAKKDKENPEMVMQSKIPDYWMHLQPATPNEQGIRAAITNDELSELSAAGLNTTYALRKMYRVSKETIAGAQIQILGGVDILVMGCAFPPSLPVLAPIATTMISEGICDIVMELISQGETGFDLKTYAKGKVISYGISLLTMGLGKIIAVEKIVKNAIKACQSMVILLRNSPRFKTICQTLAVVIEAMQRYLGRIHVWLNKALQIELSQAPSTFVQALKSAGKESLQDVVTSVIGEKIINKGINDILKFFRPSIEEKVRNVLSERLDIKKLILIKSESLNKRLTELFEGDIKKIAWETAEEIAIGAIKHGRGFKFKLFDLTIETIVSVITITNYAEKFCEQLNASSFIEESQNSIESKLTEQELKNQLIEQVTEKVYGLALRLAGKHVNTLVVNPLMGKLWQALDKKTVKSEPEPENKQQHILDHDTKKLHEAFQALGLSPKASKQDIREAYKKLILQHHPDKNPGDPGANERFGVIKAAYDLLNKQNNHNQGESAPSNRPKSGPKVNPHYNNGAPLAIFPNAAEYNVCLHENLTRHFLEAGNDNYALARRTGIYASGIGATINDGIRILNKLNLETSESLSVKPDANCAENVSKFMQKHETDRLLTFIKYEKKETMGHVVVIKQEGNELVVKDENKSVPLRQYLAEHQCSALENITVRELRHKLSGVQAGINSGQYAVSLAFTGELEKMLNHKKEELFGMNPSGSKEDPIGRKRSLDEITKIVDKVDENEEQETKRLKKQPPKILRLVERANDPARIEALQKIYRNYVTVKGSEITVDLSTETDQEGIKFHQLLDSFRTNLMYVAKESNQNTLKIVLGETEVGVRNNFNNKELKGQICITLDNSKPTTYRELAEKLHNKKDSAKDILKILEASPQEAEKLLKKIKETDAKYAKLIIDFMCITHIAETYRNPEAGPITVVDLGKSALAKDIRTAKQISELGEELLNHILNNPDKYKEYIDENIDLKIDDVKTFVENAKKNDELKKILQEICQEIYKSETGVLSRTPGAGKITRAFLRQVLDDKEPDTNWNNLESYLVFAQKLGASKMRLLAVTGGNMNINSSNFSNSSKIQDTAVNSLSDRRDSYPRPSDIFDDAPIKEDGLDACSFSNSKKIISGLDQLPKPKIIGDKEIAGWKFENVKADGNCFYRAVINQMQGITHNFLNDVCPTTPPHNALRLRIQGRSFQDGEWAGYDEIVTLMRNFDVVVAIVDTRSPERGFLYHYINTENQPCWASNLQEVSPIVDSDLIKLAYTGDHYMSVTGHPEIKQKGLQNSPIIKDCTYNSKNLFLKKEDNDNDNDSTGKKSVNSRVRK